MIKDVSNLDRYDRCGKHSMVTDSTTCEMFCGCCGYEVKEKVETIGPEWRAFSNEEHKGRSRAGIPTFLARHDMGLVSRFIHA